MHYNRACKEESVYADGLSNSNRDGWVPSDGGNNGELDKFLFV